MKILSFFLFFWVIFALLDPDPDPAAQINADPNPDTDPDPKPCLSTYIFPPASLGNLSFSFSLS
jgi:hypothetical protein